MLDAEYGATVIPSAAVAEDNAKHVNTDAKKLIARCIAQCTQADASDRHIFVPSYDCQAFEHRIM